MTAAEVLNWIAFGVAEQRDLTDQARFVKFWRVYPGSTAMRLALAEKTNQIHPADRERLRWHMEAHSHGKAYKSLPDLVYARSVVMDLLRSTELSPNELQSIYSIASDGCVGRVESLAAATSEIIQACIRGELTPVAHRPRKAADQSRLLDRLYFALQGTTLSRDGVITTPGDEGFVDVQFLTDQVLSEWPPSIPKGKGKLATAKPLGRQVQSSDAEASAWMTANVTDTIQWKRSSAILACRQALGVTDRVARRAWKALPENLKGARGKHKTPIIGQE